MVGSTTITASLDSITSNSANLVVKQVYAYLGSIGACTRNVDVSFDFVQGVAILGNFAYVSNFSSVISICPLNANGTFGTCTSTTDPSFSTPSTITLQIAP